MIKATTNKGETKLEVNGTLVELMADVAMILNNFYECLSEKDEHAGELFKKFMEDNKFSDVLFHEEEECKMDKEEAKKIALKLIEDLFS